MESTLVINTEQLLEKGVTMFQFLPWAESQIIINELLASQTFSPAKFKLGKRNVVQNFEESKINPIEAPKTMMKLRALEKELRLTIPDLSAHFMLNEFTLQAYKPPLDCGIDIHKDSVRFHDLIPIIVLKDGGKFMVYDDEFGSNPVEIPATVGSCILMRGYVPGKPDMRRYHGVFSIMQERLTLACRLDSKLN